MNGLVTFFWVLEWISNIVYTWKDTHNRKNNKYKLKKMLTNIFKHYLNN